MTPASQLAAADWYRDMDELFTALAAISDRQPYERSWRLRNGALLTVTVTPRRPAPGADPIPQPRKARPDVPEQHRAPSTRPRRQAGTPGVPAADREGG
ncbi:hypothetical protein [Kitasatospora sp. NBC_01302]|uniref:hypothetical protein n=1 Tax=Kitasatospora sp. NBC_01302 TaxID=2903575 RepID=UPI002E0DE835|nr:hypothetical protein OG294_40985 [Kitasatospora sp. NBC_01302]